MISSYIPTTQAWSSAWTPRVYLNNNSSHKLDGAYHGPDIFLSDLYKPHLSTHVLCSKSESGQEELVSSELFLRDENLQDSQYVTRY